MPTSPAGLTRGSIFFENVQSASFAKGWIAGSNPAMTMWESSSGDE